MTPRGTLGLFAVLAVLAAYLLLVPAPSPPRPPESLLAVPVERIDAVDVTWPDRQLRVRRVPQGWRTDAGLVLARDAVAELLATLATLRPMETLGARARAADYGLDARATTLVVSAGETPVLRLEVGERNPAHTGVYVRRIGSEDVVVVGALLHWELGKLHAVATR